MTDTRQHEYRLSRNHDGDILLTEDGQPVEIAAKACTPLWYAILNSHGHHRPLTKEKQMKASHTDLCFKHGINVCQGTDNYERLVDLLIEQLIDARQAMEPFRFVGSCGEGRFQTERLAMVDWHTLCKTAKAIDRYLKPTSDETPTPNCGEFMCECGSTVSEIWHGGMWCHRCGYKFGYMENIHE